MFLINCIGSGPWVQGCGNVCIPTEVAKITSLIYNMIKVIVPIALVFIGMFDMAKAVTTKSEDEVKKAQKLLTQKAIAGALVFVLFSGITWMLSILDSTSGNANKERSVASCLNTLFDYDGSSTGGGTYNRITHTTNSGDTIASVAATYGVSTQQIRNANSSLSDKADDYELPAGQEINIPVNQGYTDINSICTTNGYWGALKITTDIDDTTRHLYYTCAYYDKNNSRCPDGSIANGELFTFADGVARCVARDRSTNYARVYNGTTPDTTTYAPCGTQQSQANCTSCCSGAGYRAGYLISNQSLSYANNYLCMCVLKNG